MESGATLTQARDAGGGDDLTSRRGLLRIATSAGAGAALAAALSACGGSKTGPPKQQPAPLTTIRFGQGDVGVISYLLVVELLQLSFYRQARRRVDLSGDAASLFRRFEDQEREHVDLVRGLIQQEAGDPPVVQDPDFALGSQREVVRFAADLEGLAASAFLGQVGNIQDEALLDAVLAIHATEARHAAALQDVLGRPVSPDGAFARPRTEKQVLERTEPLTGRGA